MNCRRVGRDFSPFIIAVVAAVLKNHAEIVRLSFALGIRTALYPDQSAELFTCVGYRRAHAGTVHYFNAAIGKAVKAFVVAIQLVFAITAVTGKYDSLHY